MFDALSYAALRVGRWPRLLAAATCLLLAALSALGSARDRAAARAPARTVPVVVTTRAVPAGQVLRAADVRIARWPTTLSPPPTPGSVRAVVGRRSSGALTAREPVTAARLLGAGITAGLTPGLGAVPITVSDRSAAYVRAGDHVDVLSGPADTLTPRSGSGTAAVVAGGVTVLSVLPGDSGVDGTDATVVIAADRTTALRVAGQQSAHSFTVVLISP